MTTVGIYYLIESLSFTGSDAWVVPLQPSALTSDIGLALPSIGVSSK